ncbi:MAG: methyltransferase domain-containing protein [Saprospiraceae bacterium]|nr:methyltransferase domain-containing protein [Saprospiraceae bacterium]
MKIFMILGFILFWVSCKDQKDGTSGTLRQASAEDSSLQMVKEHEIRDRTVWQKPYDVIHKLGSLENKVIADIGAGSGYFSFRFIHEAGKVIAVDIEPDLILLMNQEKNYYRKELQDRFEARLADKDDPKLKSEEVDIIFIANTYTYLNDRINYLKNLIPKFKPDGRLMIVDFKKKLTPIGPSQNSRMAQSEVEQEILDAGYSIVESDDLMLEYQYIIVAKLDSR